MGYYSLQSNITITNPDTNQALVFDYVTEVEIKSSWKNLTDTATIRLPRKLKLNNELIQDVIKKGHIVTIQLGYAPDLVTEFTGYVSGIKATVPVEIMCEDEMWKWKQTTITKSWTSVTLKELVSYLCAQVGFKGPQVVLDANLGGFIIDGASAAKVLKEVKSTYGLISYFRNGSLHVGFAYPTEYATVNYHFQKNVIDNDLEYLTKDDAKIKVKAISIAPDNVKTEVELGDEDGEQRTLHFYNLDAVELKARATAELGKLKVDGYRGSIISFGLPVAKHGDVADVKDELYPERAGKYFIDEANLVFGVGGFRREIQIGVKAS
jgi:hypothetical protein